jgi:hypothetical protein
LGDNIISFFKRLSKIKDTGKIIPGHGGLLDRIDGMIFAFPFFIFNYLMDVYVNEKKKLLILGSTGSIGKILLNIVKKNKKVFNIILLTAHKDHKHYLNKQKNMRFKNLIITNETSYKILKKKCKKTNIDVYNNFNIFKKILKRKVDYTMNSIVGFAGLKPTLEVIKFTKTNSYCK